MRQFLFLLSIFSGLASAAPLPSWKGSDESVIGIYERLHQNFIKQSCPKGTEDEFNRLSARYRSLGYFIPFKPDHNLDTEAIAKNKGTLEAQRFWINKLVDELHSKEINIPALKAEITWMNDYLKTLLQMKKDVYLATNEAEKDKIKNQARFRMKAFRLTWNNFLSKVSFLLPYNYPVPINELRALNDKLKEEKNYLKANEVYFYRRLIEDGTSDRAGNLNDQNARLTLNTVYFKLVHRELILSEDLYSDLRYLLKFFDKVFEGGKEKQIERLLRWRERIETRYNFYQELLKKKPEEVTKLYSEENASKLNLQKFVNEKEKETYLFWARQTELMEALFSFETILYNEVGSLDPSGLDREDILQVVLNRSEMPYYWILAPEDHLYAELPHEEGRLIVGNKWLNILFKSSEFSFSYFYIPANHRIYCPEMGGLDKKLRRENLKLALKMLKKPHWDFTATRYFSRVSMPGRIDMGEVWASEYYAYPERIGKEVSSREQRKLKEQYRKGEWVYHYQFSDDKDKNFKVVEISEKYYVMPLNEIRFYDYRNPDYFRFFSKVSK